MRKLLLAVLLIGLAGGANSPPDWDDTTTTTARSPEGTWHLVRITRGGQDENAANWDMVFERDKYSWRVGGGGVAVEGNFKIELNRMPAQLDLIPGGKVPGNNNVYKAIFRIDGDVLLIGLFEPEREQRPRSFEDVNLKLLTFNRVKK